jgi:hypothetical protein
MYFMSTPEKQQEERRPDFPPVQYGNQNNHEGLFCRQNIIIEQVSGQNTKQYIVEDEMRVLPKK